MSKRITINKLEFYITNVCNLTCSGCNRYNNYKFAGWQNYDDYAEVIRRWSEKIDIIKPVILGGEPLLNPSINKWIRGLCENWNHHAADVVSNGIRIDQTPDLYKTCLETGAWFRISLHSNEHREPVFDRIRNFLTHPIQESEDPNHPVGSDYQFLDANNVQLHVWFTEDFINNNIIERADGTRTLYNSDPVLAHEACPFVIHKNYHFIKGKIYKCGPVALMPEFDSQYPLDISDEDRAVLHAGRGLSIEEFDEHGEEFFANIDNPIPQCKFCPERFDWHPIEFTKLKPNKV